LIEAAPPYNKDKGEEISQEPQTKKKRAKKIMKEKFKLRKSLRLEE